MVVSGSDVIPTKEGTPTSRVYCLVLKCFVLFGVVSGGVMSSRRKEGSITSGVFCLVFNTLCFILNC